MLDWPIWNYWMFDDNVDFIFRYDHTMDGHPDAEFLYGTDYEPEWAHRFFWTADEAAALSFGRSPTKVCHDQYMEEMDGSSEFATHFCELRLAIIEAQNAKTLPETIPACMYAEWAQRNNLPFPPALADKVSGWFKRVMSQVEGKRESSSIEAAAPGNESNGERAKETKSLREWRTVLGIIYAMAWKYESLGRHSVSHVAERIEHTLNELRNAEPPIVFEGKFKTVAKRLNEAIVEFGQPPKKAGQRDS
jgi:hypothetical protein